MGSPERKQAWCPWRQSPREVARHSAISTDLELWVISQPAGQRPADLVEWAYEILARYATKDAA